MSTLRFFFQALIAIVILYWCATLIQWISHEESDVKKVLEMVGLYLLLVLMKIFREKELSK